MSTIQYEGVLSKVEDNGDVLEMYPLVYTDETLTVKGRPADAFKVGNVCDEIRNSVIEAINIAKGRNQAVVYETYSDMITTLSEMSNEVLKRGYNIYIATPSVPDLWVYSVESEFAEYDTSKMYDYSPYFDSEGFVIFSDTEAGASLLEDINNISRSYVCELITGVICLDDSGNYITSGSDEGTVLLSDNHNYTSVDIISYYDSEAGINKAYTDEGGNYVSPESEEGIALLEDTLTYSVVSVVFHKSEVLYKNENKEYVRYNTELGAELVAGSDKYIARNVVCYTYSTLDDTVAEQLKENAFIQIGYYKVAQLETQKVDLTPVDAKLKELEERMKTMTTYKWDDETQTLDIITT